MHVNTHPWLLCYHQVANLILNELTRQVLIFELVEARTPFVLPGQEKDIAQLFTNIACVKKKGVEFLGDFDEKAGGGPECREIISGMLKFEPGDRLGNQANG